VFKARWIQFSALSVGLNPTDDFRSDLFIPIIPIWQKTPVPLHGKPPSLAVYISKDLNIFVKPALARRDCNKLLPF